MSSSSTCIQEKLKKIASKAIQTEDYETALCAIAAAGHILYMHNQVYTDETLEKQLLEIETCALKHVNNEFSEKNTDDKTVLFYDGFGLDTRGLALIFLRALVRDGYRVVYVTSERARNAQPEIHKAVEGYDVAWCYLDNQGSYLSCAIELCKYFEKFAPGHAFFYTTPNDVSATIAFMHFSGAVKRYQIDLTDHAFWLGVNAFDYCIALRDVGAKIAYHYRHISSEKLIMLPYYPTINYDTTFEGFPFDNTGRRVVFSGGALYKTLGDKNNTYYRIVDALLSRHDDLIFLYAGTGDDSQLLLLAERFPERVYHIAERKDLYQVMQNCVFYLNTYPMFGGLMMHYAAAAGKLPLTLKHEHDADGLLFDQSNLQIEYETMEQLVEDASHLLRDSNYLEEREARLKGCIITEDRFEKNLMDMLTSGKTEFAFSLDWIDTSSFRLEYKQRYRHEETIQQAIATKRHACLLGYFPVLFLKTFVLRTIKKLTKHIGKGNV